LNDINIKIKRGDKIGIIGRTASGKSTFADVLMGLLCPDLGAIYVDDIELTKLNLHTWRKNITHVPQIVHIYDGTIKMNIAFGVNSEKICEKRLNAALEGAQLKDEVSRMLLGINSPCGEAGIKLSGGQKQRISICRAILRKPKILLLDEPTSALDNDNVNKFIDLIKSLSHKMTILIISHDNKILDICDTIINI
jgi:ATP-binding cassette subfamily B protein